MAVPKSKNSLRNKRTSQNLLNLYKVKNNNNLYMNYHSPCKVFIKKRNFIHNYYKLLNKNNL